MNTLKKQILKKFRLSFLKRQTQTSNSVKDPSGIERSNLIVGVDFMNSKKLVPMLLAASVAVTGFSGAFLYAPNAAYGITSVDELSDVDRSSWAFDALRDLVEKYNVIEGYPDKTFRGDHKATRYEMAAALNALIRHIGKDIARLGTEKADKEDLAKLARLQEEFKTELAALQARTDALEARAAKIEAKNEEQDNRLTVLEKLKIYGDVTLGAYADVGSRGGNSSPLHGQGHWRHFGYFADGPGEVRQVASNQVEGMADSISALGRVRVNIDYPIVEDLDGEGLIGEGTIHTRLVGAFGRVSPLISNADVGNPGTGYGLLSGVSRVASDASAFNEGIGTSSLQNGKVVQTGSNTRANIFLDSAYYTQEFRSGIPLLTDILPGVNLLPDDEDWKLSLKMKAGLIDWREIFQKSPYTGDETQQFQNTALVNNAAIPVNVIAPTVAFEWHQGLGKWHSLDLKTALSSIDVADAMSSLAITYEASLNYNWGWLADWLDKPGNVYAGGWWMNGRGGSNSLLTTNTGYNGTQFASAYDAARGVGSNPVRALGTTVFQNLFNAQTGRPLDNNTANRNLVAAAMGLPANSLESVANLSASFFAPGGANLTAAQVRNPNTVIRLTAAQAGVLFGAGRAPGDTMTLGQYYQDLFNLGIVPAGAQPGGEGNMVGGGDSQGRFDDNDNAKGFYTGFNQELYRGSGVFFSYAVQDTGPQSLLVSALQNGTGRNAMWNRTGAFFGVKQSMNMGLELPMDALHLPWRKKDVFGIGYAQLKPQDGYGSAYSGTTNVPGAMMTSGLADGVNFFATNPNWGRKTNSFQVNNTNNSAVVSANRGTYNRSYMEHIIEAYYRVHLNDRFSLTPNVQFIINRAGDTSNDLMTVIGLRSTFKF
jgi:hypothetical protein